jgi:hypothetical protein
MVLDGEQRTVLRGIATATFFSVLFVALGWHVSPIPAPAAANAGERLAYALRCDLFAALALFAGIARVAAQRFFGGEIDGSVAPRARSLEIHRTYIQNTLEQFVLLLIAHLAFAAVEPAEHLRLLPVLVALFLLGRAAFWIGYFASPPARAFGFAATFYPTVAVLLYAAGRIALSGR